MNQIKEALRLHPALWGDSHEKWQEAIDKAVTAAMAPPSLQEPRS